MEKSFDYVIASLKKFNILIWFSLLSFVIFLVSVIRLGFFRDHFSFLYFKENLLFPIERIDYLQGSGMERAWYLLNSYNLVNILVIPLLLFITYLLIHSLFIPNKDKNAVRISFMVLIIVYLVKLFGVFLGFVYNAQILKERGVEQLNSIFGMFFRSGLSFVSLVLIILFFVLVFTVIKKQVNQQHYMLFIMIFVFYIIDVVFGLIVDGFREITMRRLLEDSIRIQNNTTFNTISLLLNVVNVVLMCLLIYSFIQTYKEKDDQLITTQI